MAWLDVSREGYFEAPSKLSVADVADRPTPLRADLVGSSPASATNIAESDSILDNMATASRYQHHSHQHQHDEFVHVEERTGSVSSTRAPSHSHAIRPTSAPSSTRVADRAQVDHRALSPSSGRALQASSPPANTRKSAAFPVKQQPVTPQSRQRSMEPDTPDLIRMEPAAPHTVADDGKDSAIEHSRYKEKKIVPPSKSRLAISKVTPRRVGGAGMSSTASTAAASVAHTSTTPRPNHGEKHNLTCINETMKFDLYE
jgi:hypothetical protein